MAFKIEGVHDWTQGPTTGYPRAISCDKTYSMFYMRTWAQQCCGLGDMWGMTGANNMLQENSFAEIVGVMVCAMIHAGGYKPWNFVYTLSDYQLDYELHKKLVSELGAVKMGASFTNLAHGPHKLHMFRVNLKNAVGKLVDNQGNVLKKAPEPAALTAKPVEEAPKKTRRKTSNKEAKDADQPIAQAV